MPPVSYGLYSLYLLWLHLLWLHLIWLHLLYQVRFGIYDRHLASGPANAHEVLIESVLASLGL